MRLSVPFEGVVAECLQTLEPPRHYAAGAGNAVVVAALLRAGASPGLADAHGRRAGEVAAACGWDPGALGLEGPRPWRELLEVRSASAFAEAVGAQRPCVWRGRGAAPTRFR